jgi:FkbH-like protein
MSEARDPQPAAAPPAVKLVVWDLDETLWGGILSEGPVHLEARRADQLRRLVDRGVMVSVSSRNDEAAARAELERHGLWELVIFPRINWEAKGAQIRDLIEAAQLRAPNVLFADDNHLNREEAAFFAPGLQVVDPADPEFDARIEAIIGAARPDPDRRRLAEYRLLEARAREAASFGDNLEFLRSCDIRVTLTERPTDTARIAELIARTNQLNYRKARVDEAGVEALLHDPDATTLAVRVTDRFGDYGLVGFAAVRDGVVEQLAFSCRILGMGVERAVYERLGRPAIDIVGPVSAPLDGPPTDWLTVVEATDAEPDAPGDAAGAMPGTASVLFVGGCDLEQAVAFLTSGERVTTHFNYSPADRPRLIVHRDSIDYLLSDEWPPGARETVAREAPFLDDRALVTPDWAAFEHVVYSPLIDYVQAKYARDDLPGVYVSFGDVLTPDLDEARIARLADRDMDPDRLRAFARDWHPVEKPDAVWTAQLERLFERLAGATSVTVLLGAATTFDGLDEERLARHRHANALVTAAAAGYPNVRVVAVDPLLRSRADFTNSIRHYSRRVYHDLAGIIGERLALDVAAEPPPAARPAVRGRTPKPAAPTWRRAVRKVRRAASSALGR